MAWNSKNVDKEFDRDVRSLLSDTDEDGNLPIVQLGEPVLRMETEKYNGQLSQKTLLRLIELMHGTMLAAPGVGLAAPQIGLGLAIAVIEDHVRDDEDDPRGIAELPFTTLINPHYEPLGEETASFYEGCLSFDGYQAVRKRYLHIKATWMDEAGNEHEQEMHNWPARIFQHETDHLSGEVYIDKAETRSLTTYDNLEDYWAFEAVPHEASEALGFEL
ncbi:peptide deformylase [Alloscardovia criceti]|uniref:peptide deformylase n=1 Tax=Alloscardovia criceti TaxID=356828 RepID=UPI00037A5C90|nr:peptide deformylase [Alloscardovia criceti]